MDNINNEQLTLVLHADLNRCNVQDVIKGIIKNEMKEVIKDTYNINRICRDVLINEVLTGKLGEIDSKLIQAIKDETIKLCESDDVKNAVKQKLNGYGSQVLNTAISEMQPYINGRVAEIIKDADIKDVMKAVSEKISDRVFHALQCEES